MNSEPTQRSDSFAVGEAARLKLANLRGSVDIRSGDAGTITVTTVKHADGNAEHTVVDIGQAPDGTVTVQTRFPDGRHGWLSLLGIRQPCRVDYTVRVPPACAVELSLVESEAFVQGLAGDFNLHTVSGRVRLADLTGNLHVHSVSGSVAGERIVATGPVNVSTVSGTVTLLAASLPAVTATTVSGGLNLETRLGEGPYVFTSVSGDIRLRVPANTRCSVSLHTRAAASTAMWPTAAAEAPGRPSAPRCGCTASPAACGSSPPARPNHRHPPRTPRPTAATCSNASPAARSAWTKPSKL